MVYTHIFVCDLNIIVVWVFAAYTWLRLVFFFDLLDINLHPYLLKFRCNFPGVDSLLQDLRRHGFV